MKKFRLLLMMSSLLALVCSFTACNTDIADRYPTIKLEVAAGAVTANSVTFTVTAEGADEIYYWVEKASEVTAEGVEDVVNRLLIEKGTYLDAQTDLPFTQEVVESGLAQTTEYTVYVYAKNFAHHAFATPVSMTTSEAVVITPPTVAVEVDEELVESEGFVAAVVTSNAQKGAWTVVPKYTEGVTAAKVLPTRPVHRFCAASPSDGDFPAPDTRNPSVPGSCPWGSDADPGAKFRPPVSAVPIFRPIPGGQ